MDGYGSISGTGKINTLILINEKTKYWLSIAGTEFTRRGLKQNNLAYDYFKDKKTLKIQLLKYMR